MSRSTVISSRTESISRPIDVARTLKSFGLGLADAHQALDRMVADELVVLKLGKANRATMIAELGVAAE